MGQLIQQLRRTVLLRGPTELTDGQLLDAYIGRKDETTLAALVERHGPLVWGVCRRILGNYHDAEDAFQATFVVLVRKATSVTPREMVANWLYGVARQTALKARATIGARRSREKQVVEMPEPATGGPNYRDELQPVLDEELKGLPDSFRAVIVLCDLEGKTRREAARQLGVPEGTVAGWVARARVMLAERLTRRGVTLSAGALAAILSQKVASGGVPASVVSNTIAVARLCAAGQAATGLISVRVAALSEGVLQAMCVSKLKSAARVLVVAACLAGIGTAISLGQPPESAKAAPAMKQEGKEVAVKAMQERLQGTWRCVSMHCGGVKSEPDMTCTIKGNAWETKLDGRVFQSGTLKLVDLDASPKQVEWVITLAEAEEDKDKTCHGIFMLDGDSLCWVASDAAKYPRPQAFFTQQDDGCCAGMFRRVDPTKDR
jgi:RNA polymerase sigma factor (sigma-70 family)